MPKSAKKSSVPAEPIKADKRIYKGETLSLRDPALVEPIRAAFVRRGMGGMTLAKMVRTALGEWLETNR